MAGGKNSAPEKRDRAEDAHWTLPAHNNGIEIFSHDNKRAHVMHFSHWRMGFGLSDADKVRRSDKDVDFVFLMGFVNSKRITSNKRLDL